MGTSEGLTPGFKPLSGSRGWRDRVCHHPPLGHPNKAQMGLGSRIIRMHCCFMEL